MRNSAPRKRALKKQKANIAPRRRRRVKKLACSEKQLKLPAGYKAGGTRMATLREVLNPNIPTTMSCAELTPEQRVKLVAKRISQQRKFKIAMVGVGVVGKIRAIDEVKKQSRIGNILMEIEQRVIENQIKRAKTSR